MAFMRFVKAGQKNKHACVKAQAGRHGGCEGMLERSQGRDERVESMNEVSFRHLGKA